MEFGSRLRPGKDQEKGHVRHEVQDLHGSCVEGRAAIFDQKRQDRPLSDAQRCGSEEAQERQPLIQETVTALDEMVKWIERIEFVETEKALGHGEGAKRG